MLDSEVEAQATQESPAPSGDSRRRRRPRRRTVLGGIGVLAVGAAGGVYALQGGESSTSSPTLELPTAPVVRKDMASIRQLDGTLGYAGGYTVLAGGGGRITWLPDVGDVIERGERVYGVDGRKVPLFYGSKPFWRDLRQGVSKGSDVEQLEQNLHELGYGDDMTVNRSFTYATALAVMEWQDDLGVPQTGAVELNAVAVQPGAIRVVELKTVLGSQSGGKVLTASSTERVITVRLPVEDQTIAKKDAEVRVTLPGGKTATGRIASIGSVATATTAAGGSATQTGQSTETATIPVDITLDGESGVGDLDGAPVTVGFSGAVHENVLAVPVNALLADAEGAYSVKTVDDSGTVRTVPVELGIFDGDMVEVKGALKAGMQVQVPRS